MDLPSPGRAWEQKEVSLGGETEGLFPELEDSSNPNEGHQNAGVGVWGESW